MSLYDEEGYFIGDDNKEILDDDEDGYFIKDDNEFEYDEYYDSIYNQVLLKQLVHEQKNQYIQSQFNNDIWYNILLKSEGAELFNLCTMNSSMRNLCQNKNIWIDKLKLNNIPTYMLEEIPYSSSWLKEYKKIIIADYNTKLLLRKNPILFNIKLQKEYLLTILPQYIVEKIDAKPLSTVYLFISDHILY
jgi:hypothetical protein